MGLFLSANFSYCGNGDTLCLIQMSNATQTMLIDIHAFKNQLKWTDDQFLDLFKLIFNHEKKIYGKLTRFSSFKCFRLWSFE
jgi:hypothetical protein